MDLHGRSVLATNSTQAGESVTGAPSQGISVQLKLGKIMLFTGRTMPLKGIPNQGVPSCFRIQAARLILIEYSRGIETGCDGDRRERRGHLFAEGQTLN